MRGAYPAACPSSGKFPPPRRQLCTTNDDRCGSVGKESHTVQCQPAYLERTELSVHAQYSHPPAFGRAPCSISGQRSCGYFSSIIVGYSLVDPHTKLHSMAFFGACLASCFLFRPSFAPFRSSLPEGVISIRASPERMPATPNFPVQWKINNWWIWALFMPMTVRSAI